MVEILGNTQCPWSAWMAGGAADRLRRLDAEVRLINTDRPTTVTEYGLTRGVCVDGHPVLKRLASGAEVVRVVKAYLSSAAQDGTTPEP